MTQRGIVAQVPPIDPGYTGNIHAILINTCKDCYQIKAGDRIGQLVMFPVVKPIFVQNKVENKGGRGDNGLGSSGK
jgi:dUTP pyrophosphatase